MNSGRDANSSADTDGFDESADGPHELHLPFARRRRHTTFDDDLRQDKAIDSELVDDGLDTLSAGAEVRMRPAPKELSRRDRREWRRLEVARINRAAQTSSSRQHSTSASWSGGFIKAPPRGLGRSGRKAWLAAEHDATTQWWAQRRASNTDIDARMAGAGVLALVIGITVIAAVVLHQPDGAEPTGPLLVQTQPTADTSTVTAAAAPATSGALITGAHGSVAVASSNGAVARTPTVPPPVSGRWQPTPAGGVPPMTPAPGTVDAAAMAVATLATGALAAADQGNAQAVLMSWLARTCPSSWRDPFGADLKRGKVLETAAGWQRDDPDRDTVGAALWRSLAVAHRQTRRCGNIAVTVSPDQPMTAHGGFVLYSADRVVTSADGQLPPAVEHLTGARRVVAADGQWLVDIPVVGG